MFCRLGAPAVGLIAGLALVGVLVGASGLARADTVNIYNWNDYIGETTLADFTAETGIEVNYDLYDSNEVLEAKLLAGSSGYDVVVPTAMPFLQRQVAAGLYAPLDRSLLPNWSELDPALMEKVTAADPGNLHSVIYQWGTNGYGYNMSAIAARMVDAPIGSLDLIFDPEVVARFADCGVAILDTPNDVLPVVQLYLGLPPNSQDPDHLALAEAHMKKLRPHIRYFHSSRYIDDLASGEICLAWGWSGDLVQAKLRGAEAAAPVEIDYVIPREGTILWFDMLAIPVDAPNKVAAHAFINYVLAPEVMAGITNYVAYGNPIPDSLPMVDPAIRDDPTIFPPPETIANLFSLAPVTTAYDRLRTRTWQRIRAGR